MSYFPWSDEYSVHLRVIDNDHKDLVSTVNDLHDAISDGSTNEQISHVIGALAKYVDEHFAREEALLEAYDYPDLARHKRIHRHLTRTVHSIRIVFGNDPTKIDPDKLLDFLRDWLVTHILKEDMRYAPFLRGDEQIEQDPAATETGSDSKPEPENGAGESDDGEAEMETVTLTVPAAKAAALRRCARLLSDGGEESIAIEDVVMPVSHMTLEEAMRFARPLLR